MTEILHHLDKAKVGYGPVVPRGLKQENLHFSVKQAK
jgi:hypothetical protein